MATEKAEKKDSKEIKLNSLFALKLGMSTVFNDKGEAQNVTLLKYEPMIVSQLKTKEKNGYSALQVAFLPKRASRTTKAQGNHLKKAGFENGARYVREIRQDIPEGAEVGARVSIESLVVGDQLKITGTSKGKGFAGVVKRHGFQGGPATHGSHFHRIPGSVGNREFPGRVMPGRKMPGHLGMETATILNLSVVDVLAKENILMVYGSVPGSRNSLVKLTKI